MVQTVAFLEPTQSAQLRLLTCPAVRHQGQVARIVGKYAQLYTGGIRLPSLMGIREQEWSSSHPRARIGKREPRMRRR